MRPALARARYFGSGLALLLYSSVAVAQLEPTLWPRLVQRQSVSTPVTLKTAPVGTSQSRWSQPRWSAEVKSATPPQSRSRIYFRTAESAQSQVPRPVHDGGGALHDSADAGFPDSGRSIRLQPSLVMGKPEPGPEHSQPVREPHEIPPTPVPDIPDGHSDTPGLLSDWWRPLVARPFRGEDSPRRLGLQALLVSALRHSRQIRVYSEEPLIQESSVTEADATYDWSAFVESTWSDSNQPVGNTLTAGAGVERFEDRQLESHVGVRKTLRTGGELELSQRFGSRKNNSTFFQPNPQATARLVLSYSQPLLRGAGRCYNQSFVVLASLDKQIANDDFRRQLQEHLLQVTRAYWTLYLERGVLIQKMNSYRRARTIVDRLEQRPAVDACGSQIASAQAELKTRSAALVRADTTVRNAESRIRSLVNDPSMTSNRLELIPTDSPRFDSVQLEMQGALGEAFRNRPEVTKSLKRIRAATIRTENSRNELLPILNLVTRAYASGLDREYDTLGALSRQLDRGNPSYSVGFQYEIPIGNRAARARHIRRHQEMRRAKNQYQATLETIRLDVEVAVREVLTAEQERSAKQQAMEARVSQLHQLTRRWERLAGQDVSASLALDNLLTSQERLGEAEHEFLKAQMAYSLSLMNVKKATGTLLQSEGVNVSRGCAHGVPLQMVSKPEVRQ